MTEDQILRRVARSFHVTLRLLPPAMRGDVCLGYLLARAADTVADASPAAPRARLDLLRSARSSLDRSEVSGFDAADWAVLQRDEGERALLRAWPALWRRMHGRPAEDRARLQTVLGHILDGQIFDLERFEGEGAPLASAELDRYTYLVAGSVGEFWTDLGFARVRGFASEPAEVMRGWARHYGRGLQLVNILRDQRMDAAVGRHYVQSSDVTARSAQAAALLSDGARYCAALGSGRLRYATILPALLGWRTLALLGTQPPGLVTPVKVPRRELRRWMRKALAVWWSPRAVARLAGEASDQGQHHAGQNEKAS